jgi:hypothetical protein
MNVRCKDRSADGWDEYVQAKISKGNAVYPWQITNTNGIAFNFMLCQVFDETPAPDPEWQEPTVDMVGKEVLAQFRHSDSQAWGEQTTGILQAHQPYERWSIHGKSVWYRQCRVKPLDTPKAKEPKAEASKTAADDGWRDAVWPDDWGMICRMHKLAEVGVLVGYDPLGQSDRWLFSIPGIDVLQRYSGCQVNDRLPRFVMPGGGK